MRPDFKQRFRLKIYQQIWNKNQVYQIPRHLKNFIHNKILQKLFFLFN